jgi:group I intron endonuclease
MFVYKIKNNINGKLYVGKTSKTLDARLRVHVQHTCETHYRKQLITKAIRKYGVESFEMTVLEECVDNDTASNREKFWIKELDTKNRLVGYNMTDGGEGTPGRIVTDETRQKLKNRVFSDETRQKMSASAKKKIISEEVRIRKSLKQSASIAGNKNPFFGKDWGRKGPLSEETKTKLSAAHRGKILSDEHKSRIRAAMKKVDRSIIGSNKGKVWPIFGYVNEELTYVYDGFDSASRSLNVEIKKLRVMTQQKIEASGILLKKGNRMSREDVEMLREKLEVERSGGYSHGLA